MNIFIKLLGIGTTFCLNKYELSARLLLYTGYTSGCGRHYIQKGMNRPDKETLRCIIRKMHKQNNYEKFIELKAAFANVEVKMDFYTFEFPAGDPYHPFPLPLKNIHSVTKEESRLYILCNNNNLHILDLAEKEHIVILLEKQSLWELFCWTGRSCWDYFCNLVARIIRYLCLK